jgi:histone deacetylase complex regulatory component SIN3
MVKYSSYHDNKKDNYRSDRNLGINKMHLIKKVIYVYIFYSS